MTFCVTGTEQTGQVGKVVMYRICLWYRMKLNFCVCLQYGYCIGFLKVIFTYICQYLRPIDEKCMNAFGISQLQSRFYSIQSNCQEHVMNSTWKANFQS